MMNKGGPPPHLIEKTEHQTKTWSTDIQGEKLSGFISINKSNAASLISKEKQNLPRSEAN